VSMALRALGLWNAPKDRLLPWAPDPELESHQKLCATRLLRVKPAGFDGRTLLGRRRGCNRRHRSGQAEPAPSVHLPGLRCTIDRWRVAPAAKAFPCSRAGRGRMAASGNCR